MTFINISSLNILNVTETFKKIHFQNIKLEKDFQNLKNAKK